MFSLHILFVCYVCFLYRTNEIDKLECQIVKLQSHCEEHISEKESLEQKLKSARKDCAATIDE